MGAWLHDLRDEVDALRRLLAAAGDVQRAPEVAAAVALMDAALAAEPDDGSAAASLIMARDAFHDLGEAEQRRALNGWTPQPERPPRASIVAALELASVRRVLSFAVTDRTVCPSHHWALCDGDARVRIEVQEGTTHEELLRALGRVSGMLAKLWDPYLIDPDGAKVAARPYGREDMRVSEAQGTAQGPRKDVEQR